MLDDLMEVLKKEAAIQFPKEACGVVVDVGNKRPEIRVCRNVSREPENAFLLSPNDYREAKKAGKIVAIWHTHPKTPPIPSDSDLSGIESTQTPYVIVSVRKNGDEFTFSEPKVYNPTGFQMPYLKRPYIEGIFDCYGLLRDYYEREYGIHITNYPRVEDDGVLGYTKFLERYEQEGFVRLIDKLPQKGDVFLMQLFENVPNHIAIYIGDNKIMHHNRDRFSRVEVWGGYWQKCTTHHLRHKTKC